ncbi:MAG TPA: substrate-binding domain-containing protein, partial [Herbaspirillum sp.]|nr:substrate-binding domain-containing protein [Herbaspirillum sp.]
MKKFLNLSLAAGLALAVSANALAADLKLYAAAGVKSPVERMAADFEKTTGQKITLIFDTAGAAQQKFLADPDAALLITTATLISKSVKSDTLKDGTTTIVGDTLGARAGKPGQPKPDISTSE